MSAKKSKRIEYLDFEISFYEALLKDNPRFVDAMIPLGDSYTKRGLYDKGLEIDIKLAECRPDDPFVFYNLACSYSLMKKTDLALDALKKAVNLGYNDFKWIEKDPDMENVRKDGRYRDLIRANVSNSQSV